MVGEKEQLKPFEKKKNTSREKSAKYTHREKAEWHRFSNSTLIIQKFSHQLFSCTL